MSGTLAHGPDDVIARLLIGAGCATEPSAESAWPVYVSSEPNLPDNCLFTKETAGRLLGFSMPDSEQTEFYGIQVKIRAKDYPTGYPRYNLVKLAIDQCKATTVTVGVNTYEVTTVRTGVVPLGYNNPKDRRWAVYLNILASIRQTG